MNNHERRQRIGKACEDLPSLYANLVAPVNALLDAIDIDISEQAADQVVENLGKYARGEIALADCHLAEADNFIRDGMRAIADGDVHNGMVQVFGAGLNFASYLTAAQPMAPADIFAALDRRFRTLAAEPPAGSA